MQFLKNKISSKKYFLNGNQSYTFENKKFVDITQQCFALLTQATFPLIIWIFTEGEGDGFKFRLPS